MHDKSERDDSSGGLPEDDSLVGKVFDAIEDEAAADVRRGTAATDASAAPREEAYASLEDSFKAEVDEPLLDDFDDDDESPAATIPVTTPRGAAERGLRGFLGLVGGALLSVAVALLILLWGLRRDPFAISTRLPKQLVFLLPPEFRTVNQQQTTAPENETAPAKDTFGIGD